MPSVEGNHREFFNSVLTQTGNSILLQPVMLQEIVEIVSAFKGNTSPGFDDISPLIIKTVISCIAKPLADVIDTSFNQGVNGVMSLFTKFGSFAGQIRHGG